MDVSRQTIQPTESPQGWSPLRIAGLLLLGAISVFATLDAWGDIAFLATRHEENSHILLVPVVAAWLAWVRKDAILAAVPKTSWLGPCMIGLGWGLSWFGYYNATQSMWHLGAVMALIGAVVTWVGPRLLLRAWPAFVVLALMVPVPASVRELIALPLQRATATATEFSFHLMGIDVVRHGNLLQYNGHDIAVAEACNGMRMVWALFLVSFVVAFGSPLKPWVRVAILVVSPLSAVICNVLRMAPTVLAYGHWSIESADLFHDLSGWAMIVLAFVLLLGFLELLRWIGFPTKQGESWDDMDDDAQKVNRAKTVSANPGQGATV